MSFWNEDLRTLKEIAWALDGIRIELSKMNGEKFEETIES